MSKNITIISPNFWPEDTAIGLYNTQLSNFLIDNKYKVTIITAFPYYPQWSIYKAYKSKPFLMEENFNGIRILRSRQYIPSNPTFSKRILHLISFTFGSFINLFKTTKPDVVISIIPFTTSVLLGWLLKLRYKSKLWVHVQDFEFDAASQTGYGSKTNGWFKILFSIEKILLNKANITSTISYSMINMLKQKSNTESYFLPNWIDENKINPNNFKQHKFLNSVKTKILYSGNIGEKQDWNIFLEFCKDIDPEIYHIVVVGDGAKKNWLKGQIQSLKHVSYHPPVPYEDLSDLLCCSDFHILFQKLDVVDTVMPSKILGMMASGKPSIVIGNKASEINQIFIQSKGGIYFDSYSKAIIETFEQLRTNPSNYLRIGDNARQFVLLNFSKNEILGKMLKKLETIRQQS